MDYTQRRNSRVDTKQYCGLQRARSTFSISILSAFRHYIQAKPTIRDQKRASSPVIQKEKIPPMFGKWSREIGKKAFGTSLMSKLVILRKQFSPVNFRLNLCNGA